MPHTREVMGEKPAKFRLSAIGIFRRIGPKDGEWASRRGGHFRGAMTREIPQIPDFADSPDATVRISRWPPHISISFTASGVYQKFSVRRVEGPRQMWTQITYQDVLFTDDDRRRYPIVFPPNDPQTSAPAPAAPTQPPPATSVETSKSPPPPSSPETKRDARNHAPQDTASRDGEHIDDENTVSSEDDEGRSLSRRSWRSWDWSDLRRESWPNEREGIWRRKSWNDWGGHGYENSASANEREDESSTPRRREPIHRPRRPPPSSSHRIWRRALGEVASGKHPIPSNMMSPVAPHRSRYRSHVA